MSFNTHMTYANELPPDYYPEDIDNYDEEYCENNVMEENQNVYIPINQNLTDIQLNNKQLSKYPQPVKLSKKYQQCAVGQNVSPQCCYVKKCPPSSKVVSPCLNYQPEFYGMHQCCPLSSVSQQDTTYDTLGYRTAAFQHNITPHYSYRNIQSAQHSQAHQKTTHSKRYPITAPTPKYYRKPASPSLYKRPSALCLPIASQPDPAVYKRSKRQSSDESPLEIQQTMLGSIDPPATLVQKKKTNKTEVLHKMDSEGDVTFKGENLEQMLEQLEISSPEDIIKNKNNIAKLSKFFKPKLPPSLKNKKEQPVVNPDKTYPESEGAKSPSPEAQEYEKTRDSLDKLLQQLKKCEMPSSNEAIEKHEFQSHHEGNQLGRIVDSQIDVGPNRRNENVNEDKRKRNLDVKSFNYQDISEQITRTQEEMKGCTDSARESTTSIQEITKRLSSSVSSSSGKPRSVVPKPTLDDHCALELHRSKSYIVNLIDRALSKELGTIPSERTNKQFDDMTPRKAIEVMNRHSYCKPEKALSVEITSALTDSIISTATAPTESQVQSSNSKKICCCTTEEPTYIKQLKQLRWGHLKHIQREVRRLEDLERFLDSCSITTIPEM